MKIVIIHGQNHAGSTCMVARELAHKVGGEIRFFSATGQMMSFLDHFGTRWVIHRP